MLSTDEVQPPEFPRQLPQPLFPAQVAAAAGRWREAIVLVLVAVTLVVLLAWLIIVGLWAWEVVEQVWSPSG
jgi:hypothetical protein